MCERQYIAVLERDLQLLRRAHLHTGFFDVREALQERLFEPAARSRRAGHSRAGEWAEGELAVDQVVGAGETVAAGKAIRFALTALRRKIQGDRRSASAGARTTTGTTASPAARAARRRRSPAINS